MHSFGQIARQAGIGLVRIAPEERHDDECGGAALERIGEHMLVEAVGLAHEAPYPIALDGISRTAAWRKPDLERHIVAGRAARYEAK